MKQTHRQTHLRYFLILTEQLLNNKISWLNQFVLANCRKPRNFAIVSYIFDFDSMFWRNGNWRPKTYHDNEKNGDSKELSWPETKKEKLSLNTHRQK